MLREVTTSDGIRLHGDWQPRDETVPPHPFVDAVLLLHGTGSNFYSSSLWNGLMSVFRQAGLGVMTVNTRGHDGMYLTVANSGKRLLGAAYELLDECPLDVAAWVESLAASGQRRVALVGHSAGGVKAIYAQAHAPLPTVRAVLALSPPRLSHREFQVSGDKFGFNADLRRAEQLVAADQGDTLLDVRFPLPYLISARGFLDKYGPAERYNVLNFAGQLTVPQLYTFGSLEVQHNAAFRGLPNELEALAAHAQATIDVELIAGADHVYSMCHTELATRCLKWLARQHGSTAISG